MAPEILTGKGYSYIVDFWSLGVSFYGFLCGGMPYGEEVNDPYDIYDFIVTKELTFPNFLQDEQAKICIRQLLSQQPETRLGNSIADLKAHAWFEGFDWDKLYTQQLKPPSIPPQDQMISDTEIKTQIQQGKFIQQEIEEQQSKRKIKQNQILDLDWDESF
ncbi:unnamed protein product [Paramecium octaurelia]|nr:unnamed protein product [Paramecium octaurelia]